MLFKINIIDDEKNLNDLVRTYLEKEGFLPIDNNLFAINYYCYKHI